LKFKSGILYKYCKNVSDASHGCITDKWWAVIKKYLELKL
jgi:hypothetical protein